MAASALFGPRRKVWMRCIWDCGWYHSIAVSACDRLPANGVEVDRLDFGANTPGDKGARTFNARLPASIVEGERVEIAFVVPGATSFFPLRGDDEALRLGLCSMSWRWWTRSEIDLKFQGGIANKKPPGFAGRFFRSKAG